MLPHSSTLLVVLAQETVTIYLSHQLAPACLVQREQMDHIRDGLHVWDGVMQDYQVWDLKRVAQRSTKFKTHTSFFRLSDLELLVQVA